MEQIVSCSVLCWLTYLLANNDGAHYCSHRTERFSHSFILDSRFFSWMMTDFLNCLLFIVYFIRQIKRLVLCAKYRRAVIICRLVALTVLIITYKTNWLLLLNSLAESQARHWDSRVTPESFRAESLQVVSNLVESLNETS